LPDTHFFNVSLAVKYGVENAVLLSSLCYWVRHNSQNNSNFFEGRFWTYNTLAAFKKQFPYFTQSQIRTVLANLKKSGAVVTGNFNKRSFDRTLWYSVADDVMLVYDPPKPAAAPDGDGKGSLPPEDPPPEREPAGGDAAPEDGAAERPPPICKNSQMHLSDSANAFAESRKPIPDIDPYIYADSSASAKPEKIPQKHAREEAEAEDVFSVQKLKEAFAKISPLLVFDRTFYPKAADTLGKYGLDAEYSRWLFKFCEKKKPDDLTAYYFRVFCKENVIARFAASRAPPGKTPAVPEKTPCPVCGTVRAEGECCPSCGFSGNPRDIQAARFIYAMPPDRRAAYNAERASVLASERSFNSRVVLLKDIRKKYGVPD
jgi:hypothetical protein